MALTPEDWQQIKHIFNELIELPKEEIPAALEYRCAEHPHIKKDLEAMVETHLSTGEQTITPKQSAASKLLEQTTLKAGDRFDRYQIIQSLGSGGMGQVYLAQRDDEVVQQVAIKVLNKHSMDAQALARFDAERRILASLEHPNIARLIDAGSEGDCSYYVMEYVDGIPIDQYCQTHQLPLIQRLKLFQQICDAVAFAHSNLIVHRDLKPGNILVTQQGEVKLLDFGIAKPLKTLPGTDQVHETLVGTTALTPQYAAPEQINGEPITVTCDVYVLGLLLFRLLTDQHAFALEGKTWGEIERVINEQLPTLPSRLLRRLPDPKPNWQNKLKGDLDAIVSHALKKEAEQRYLGVREMSVDIGHYLNNEPLQIKQSQTGYRLKKHLRKHWLPISALAVIFVVLSTSSVMIWRQSQTIAEERDKALTEKLVAEEVTNFLVDTFKSADPTQTLGSKLTAGDILEQGVKQLNSQEISSGVKNRLSETLGDVYLNLGLFEQSESMYQIYQSGLTDALNDDRVIIKKAELSYRRGNLDQVRQLINEIDTSTATALSVFAKKKLEVKLETQSGDFKESELKAQELLKWTLENFDQGSRPHVDALMTLADSKGLDVSKNEEILDVYLQAKKLTENQPQYKIVDLEITARIAGLYSDLNQYTLAEKYASEYSDQTYKIYGSESLSYAKSIGILANIYYRLDKPDAALPLRLKVIEIRKKFFGEYDAKMAVSYYNTAIVYAERLQEYELSVPFYEKAFKCLEGATGSSLISLNFMKINYSMTLIELGHYDKAEHQLFELLEFYKPYKLKAQRNETWINLLLAYLYDKTDKYNLIDDRIYFVTPRLELFSPNSVYRSIYHNLIKKHPHLRESKIS